jgi:hypothetical protein
VPKQRPKAYIKSIKFSDDTELHLARHEILVFVGPNNAGKSAALREIFSNLQSPNVRHVVVKSVIFGTEGSEAEAVEWADSLPRRAQIDPTAIEVPSGTLVRTDFQYHWSSGMRGGGFQSLASLIAALVSADGRSQFSNQVQAINLYSETPVAPLHHLYASDAQEMRLSRLFQQAFGEELIVNRTAGSTIMLHMGKRPVPSVGQDRFSAEYRDALHKLPLVHEQGDGIRSFLGVLLHALVVDRDMILIDEPEAFLHPPQANLLGRVLATEVPNPRQLIVATHSTDFLRGALDAPNASVRIVRVRRSGNVNLVRELSPDAVRKVWRDPLLRYSNILDGLFHEGVIVCEADGDCRFYEAMMDVVAGAQARPDLLLVHVGGKARVATIVRALRAIDVPVRTVLDFDALSDEAALRSVCESLGGNWDDLRADFRVVKSAIEQRRPQLATKQVKENILQIIDTVRKDVLSDDAIKGIREVLRGASAWSDAKRMGKAYLPSGDASAAYTRLNVKLRSLGVFLVEVGELEQFCKTTGDHGPAWVVKVLERDLANDPELAAAREFAGALLTGWNA